MYCGLVVRVDVRVKSVDMADTVLSSLPSDEIQKCKVKQFLLKHEVSSNFSAVSNKAPRQPENRQLVCLHGNDNKVRAFSWNGVEICYLCMVKQNLMIMEQMMRKYPVGIQTFSEIIREGYLYVDKTDLVWQLAHYAKFVFMSRPRRFGKSLLTSTLESYFKGDRELFKGLKIMSLEKEWTQYPVIHLDLSVAKGQDSAKDLRETLMWMMKPLAEIYGRADDETTPGKLLTGLIHRAKEKTGRQVAVIIDEYDAPLLDVLHSQETLDAMRKVMQEFYVPLKANEQYIKFCFITGITKFSQLSIFSTINNLKNVSLLPNFATICGFTEHEVQTVFKEDIVAMAEDFKLTPEEMYAKIKFKYDGYHFAGGAEAVFNPFSLLNALGDRLLKNYWFASGTPTILVKQM